MGTQGLTGEVQAAAERLRQAGTLRRPCRSPRDLVGEDLSLALAVQRHVLALQSIGGATRVGGKLGPIRTGAAGVRSTGVLLDSMCIHDGTRVPTSRLLQPRVELKLAATVIDELPSAPGDLSPAELLPRVAVSLVLEAADCRIADPELTLVDEICDNAGAGLFVLGAEPVPASVLGPEPRPARLEVDSEMTWRGTASVPAALVDVRTLAAAWLAAGQPLRVGEVVLTSALGPAVPVVEGQHFSAYVAGLTSVTLGFTTTSKLTLTERPT